MHNITKSLFWVPLSLLLVVPLMANTKPDYKAVRVSGTERASGVVQLVDKRDHDRGRGYAWGRRDRDWNRRYRRDWDDYYRHNRRRNYYYYPYSYGYSYPYNYNYGYVYPYNYYSYPYSYYNYPYYYRGPGFSFRLWR